MSTTEHDTLLEAFLAAQQAMPQLHTNDDATVESNTGKSYKYKYLTLDRLLADVMPVLNEHGLIWVTFPMLQETGQPVLRYQLVHAKTGELVEGSMPLYLGSKQTSQAYGSAITYARRYAMLAVLGLAPDDDDGKQASEPDPPKMAPGLRKQLHAALLKVPDARLLLTSLGISTRASEWLATDAPKIQEALDARNLEEKKLAENVADKFNGTVEETKP